MLKRAILTRDVSKNITSRDNQSNALRIDQGKTVCHNKNGLNFDGLRIIAIGREGVLGFTSGLRNMAIRREGVLGFTSGLRNMATRGERASSALLLGYVTWPHGERAFSALLLGYVTWPHGESLTFELRNMATGREGVIQGERAFSRKRGRSRLHF